MKTLSFYVAGKYEERGKIANLIRELRQRGHSITHDWTHEDDTGLEGEAREQYLRSCAIDDRRGAGECKVFVLVHNPACRGAFAELGIAIGSTTFYPKRFIVIGWDGKSGYPIFYHLPGVIRVESIAEFLYLLDNKPDVFAGV